MISLDFLLNDKFIFSQVIDKIVNCRSSNLRENIFPSHLHNISNALLSANNATLWNVASPSFSLSYLSQFFLECFSTLFHYLFGFTRPFTSIGFYMLCARAYEIFNGFPCEKHDKSYAGGLNTLPFSMSSSNATLYSRGNLYDCPLPTSLLVEKILLHARLKRERYLLKKG